MKKNLIVMFVFVMVAGFSMAQGAENKRADRKHPAKMETPEVVAKKMTSNMVKKLSLNDAQEKTLLKLNTKFAQDRLDQKKEMIKLREAQKKEMKKIADKREEQLKMILTPEQYKTYQDNKMSKSKKNKMGKRGKMGKRNNPRQRPMPGAGF